MKLSHLLEGKTIAITGASRGIGKVTAKLCAEAGGNLVLIARSAELLKELEDELKAKYPVTIHTYSCDVTDRTQLADLFKDLQAKQVLVDCLVNNAGVMKDAMLQVVKPELIEEIYKVNVFAAMYASQLAMKGMIRKRAGSIINLSSIIGTQGSPGYAVYGSSKAALVGLTKSLAKELAPFNIRVNAIAPGFIDTDMTQRLEDQQKAKTLASIGMKRIGTANDVARVIVFLASDLSEYVTGQVIGIDGGMVM